jgi:NADH dehydrogenase
MPVSPVVDSLRPAFDRAHAHRYRVGMHAVIAGCGFGGLAAARRLANSALEVTIIDRANHHLFQPLLYQVATAGLSPADIASPIRAIFRYARNVRVLLDELISVDFNQRELVLAAEKRLGYDFLVLATGGRTSYFGHDQWETFAPGLKDLDDAVEIRRRVLLAFETAEREPDPAKRRDALKFVIVGGGPTGVELAGALAEVARFTLARDFRNIDPSHSSILLIEGEPRLLMTFPEDLAVRAKRDLEQLGVQVRLNTRVSRIDEHGVWIGDEFVPAQAILWSAGVQPTGLSRALGVSLDKQGRVIIGSDLTLAGHAEVFAIGDMATFTQDGRQLTGVAAVAIQMGEHAAENILRANAGKPYEPFRYHDKGSLATIGRSKAVAQFGKLHLTGFVAWIAWLLIHIYFLIGFRNRMAVLFNWAWSYVTYQRGARLITGRRLNLMPRRPMVESKDDFAVR